MRIRWLILIIVLLLFPVSGFADTACKCSIISPGKLQLIGDSQCAGSFLIVPKVIETKQWRTVQASCKNGTSTLYWVNRINSIDLSASDAIIVYLGSNDWGHPDPNPILKKIALSKAKCIWVGPPLIRGKDNGVAEHLKRVIEADKTCIFLDSRTLHLRLEDGVHPGSKEHIRWLRTSLANF